MRELKFRCFDLENKTMNYWDLDHYDRENHDVFGNAMQFTGLHDINGQPAYEGDIVIMYDNEGSAMYYNIEWKPDCYMMVGDGGPGEWLSMEEFEGCVIVGNKYENPELNPR